MNVARRWIGVEPTLATQAASRYARRMHYTTIYKNGVPWIVCESCLAWQVRFFMRELQRSDAVGATLTMQRSTQREIHYFEAERRRVWRNPPYVDKLVAFELP